MCSARLQNGLPRTDQGRIVARIADELEREVRFDRGAHFCWPAWVDGPTAIRPLPIQYVPGIPIADRLVLSPQKCQQEDRFGLENRVALEFANPVPVGLLPATEPGSRSLLRGLKILRGHRIPTCREARKERISGLLGCAYLPVGDHAFLPSPSVRVTFTWQAVDTNGGRRQGCSLSHCLAASS